MRAHPIVFVAVIACLSCGDDSPEQRLAEARERLEEAREEVEALEARVDERSAEVAEAKEALAEVRKELDQAEEELAVARRKTDSRATDVALFRAVQKALLERAELEPYAIRVEVAGQDHVTLHGEVDEASQAELAVETARKVAGVGQVVDRIEVKGARAVDRS